MERFASLIVCLATLLASGVASGEDTDGPLGQFPVTIRVYDYTETDQSVLERSERVAASVLAEAGVAVDWTWADPSGSSGDSDAVLKLRLQRAAPATKFKLKAWEFGYSIPSASGFGDIAGVLVDRATDFARSRGIEQHVVLGYVMAHEVGHLLLGVNGHARKGIMKRRWGARDLRLARMGALGFTAPQARRMRKLLVARITPNRRAETAQHSAIAAPIP